VRVENVGARCNDHESIAVGSCMKLRRTQWKSEGERGRFPQFPSDDFWSSSFSTTFRWCFPQLIGTDARALRECERLVDRLPLADRSSRPSTSRWSDACC